VTVNPSAAVERVEVLSNARVASGVGLLSLLAPRCAASILPGQFVHLRITRGSSYVLRRPFSVHRAHGGVIEILYQVLGVGTRDLALIEAGNKEMDIVGPLGHGWEIPATAGHALLVSGGLGAAPLGMLAEELADRGIATVAAMGAPSAERLVARDLFENQCRATHVATDDGSAGDHGFVVAVSQRLLDSEQFDVVYTCGPEVMQSIVARQARDAGVACQVSLERLMACGIGACLSCVVTTNLGTKRACVDGPVFDAREVVWNASEIPPKH
jgi:dihydroorotate dehydrogenase electron transfer subunit